MMSCAWLVQIFPMLPRIDMEIEVVECGQVLSQNGGNAFDFRLGLVDTRGWPTVLIRRERRRHQQRNCGNQAESRRPQLKHLHRSILKMWNPFRSVTLDQIGHHCNHSGSRYPDSAEFRVGSHATIFQRGRVVSLPKPDM